MFVPSDRPQTRARFVTVAVGATPVQVLPANPKRKSLLIRASQTASIYIGFNSALATTNGIQYNINGPDFRLDDVNWPDAIKQEFWIVASLADNSRIIEEEYV